MDIIIVNSENSKTSDPHRLLCNLWDKVNLKRIDKYVDVALSSLSFKNNKLKKSAPTWNEEFELPDGSYSAPDIQDCFEYIIKKHETVTDNLSIMIYVDKIENRITFKIKT